MRVDVLDYVGFGTMQLGFTIFTKLFHSVQFSLLWSFLRKLLRRPLTATNKSKTEPFWLCFTHGLRFFRSCGVFFENSFILDYAAFGTMQLRFIIFYKIISLRSVPHNQARPTANPPSPINCCKQIQN